jgi:hypothetical protein
MVPAASEAKRLFGEGVVRSSRGLSRKEVGDLVL